MNRRTLLATVIGAVGGLAGCASDRGDRDETTDSTNTRTTEGGPAGTSTPSPTPSANPSVPLAQRGRPADICSKDVLPVGIVAIVEPSFAPDWSGHDTAAYDDDLDGDAVVVGLEVASQARAYPLEVLWKHEIVNDDFGGPIVVTYCPLCASGLVAERTVDGERTTFGVSGRLWEPPGAETQRSRDDGRIFGAGYEASESTPVPERDHNLVMYDAATGSYWSQLLATAICGPRRGDQLSFVPSTVASWADWRSAHPETEVLLPPPHSTARNPPIPEPSEG